MRIGRTKLVLVQGDITVQQVDALVNAANSALSGGGGVDGAIHRAAGPSVLQECRAFTGGCPAGQAVSTSGGALFAKRIIHAVGPVWRGGSKGEEDLLTSVYRQCLQLAMRDGCRTVAFPSISTGAYQYPIGRAAKTAISAVTEVVREHPGSFDEVRFVVFSKKDLEVYKVELSAESTT